MNNVSVVNNVLSTSLIEKIHEHVVDKSAQYALRPNYVAWDTRLTEGSTPVMTMDIHEFREDLHESIAKAVPEVENMDLFIPFPMFYSMPPLSHIGWHEDYTPINVSIYLNDFWNRSWGGLFVYENEKLELRAIQPEFNKAVIIKNNINHCVSMIPPHAPVHRFSIQLFFTEKE
jgi:hypothetical protein